MPASPWVFAGKLPIKIEAVAIYVHEFGQHVLPFRNRITGQMDVISGEMTLKALLQKTTEW